MKFGRKKGILPFMFLILLLVSIAIFLLIEDKTPQFWVSYAAGIIAVIVVSVGTRKTFKIVNQPASIVYLTISFIYVVAVAYSIYYTYILVRFPLKWCVAIHILLLSMYLLIFRLATVSNQYISDQEQSIDNRKQQSAALIDRILLFQAEFSNIGIPNVNEISKMLNQLQDKMRYIAPPVNENAKLRINDIERAVSNLEEYLEEFKKGNIGIEDIRARAGEVERNIELYNRVNMHK